MENVKGAIFDIDGTLLDSMHIWNTVGDEYLLKYGIVMDPNRKKSLEVLSLRQTAEFYRNEYKIEKSVEEIMNDINRMIENFYFNEAVAKKGVSEFLSLLKSENIKMCVVTATDKYLVEAALKKNNLLDYFSEIFTCTDVGVSKTNPLIFLKAAKYLNVKVEETVVFDDALYALNTAVLAGFKTIGVYDLYEDDNWEKIKTITYKNIKCFDEIGVNDL